MTSALSETAHLDVVRRMAMQPNTETSTARVHLTGATPSNTFSIVEFSSEPGKEPPVTTSVNEDRFFCLLEGEWDVRVGTENFRVKAGGSFFAPRGVAYEYRILSPSGRAVVLITYGQRSQR